MIKVEIMQSHVDKSVIKTIKVFGLTVYKKIVKPAIKEDGSIELFFRV